MDNTELKLLSPVINDGETIGSLTLRELTVEELLAIEKSHGSKSAFEQDIHTFALSCGVSPDVIKKLKQRDWGRLRAKYWDTVGNVLDDQEDQTSA